MRFVETKGIQYVVWWEPHFPHHVVVFPNPNLVSSRYRMGIEVLEWMNTHYPDLCGDTSQNRLAEDDRPYHSYDWGYTLESSAGIFYFKDPAVAAHFKLVWG